MDKKKLVKKFLGTKDFAVKNNFGSKNKAFVGLGSCDNVQTEMPILEYANWPKLRKVRLADPSS